MRWLIPLVLAGCAAAQDVQEAPKPSQPAGQHLTLQCGTHGAVQGGLAAAGQDVMARGVTHGGRILELYISPDGRWTMVLNLPSGEACLYLGGEAWTADRGNST